MLALARLKSINLYNRKENVCYIIYIYLDLYIFTQQEEKEEEASGAKV